MASLDWLSQTTHVTVPVVHGLTPAIATVLDKALEPPCPILCLNGFHNETVSGARARVDDFNLLLDCTDSMTMMQLQTMAHDSGTWTELDISNQQSSREQRSVLAESISRLFEDSSNADGTNMTTQAWSVALIKSVSPLNATRVTENVRTLAQRIFYAGHLTSSAFLQSAEPNAIQENISGVTDLNDSEVPILTVKASWTVDWPFSLGDRGQYPQWFDPVQCGMINQVHGPVTLEAPPGNGRSALRNSMRRNNLTSQVGPTIESGGVSFRTIQASPWGVDT